MLSLGSLIPISIINCQAAVKKLHVYLSRAEFSLIYFSCPPALTNTDVYLSLSKNSSSLVNIQICLNQLKLVSAIREGEFEKSYNKPCFQIYQYNMLPVAIYMLDWLCWWTLLFAY